MRKVVGLSGAKWQKRVGVMTCWDVERLGDVMFLKGAVKWHEESGCVALMRCEVG